MVSVGSLCTSYRFVLLHDHAVNTQDIEADVADFSQYHCIFSHAAIQVQFLQNKSTVNEGNFMVPLTIQLLLTPADETLQFNIIIQLSFSSGSATGTVHEQLKISPTQVYCTFMIDTCCEVVLSMYSM